MNKINCLLIDDEPPAIQLLEKYAGMIDSLHVVGSSQSAVKAFDLLKKHSIDLIFLDIRMPVLSGLDFIQTLTDPPAVILTTAYREYAFEGYDLNVIDYLLKPIAFDRFLKAVDRYIERSATKPLPSSPDDTPDYFYVNIKRTHHKITLDEILYVESLKDYVRIHMKDNALVVKGNIGSFMKKLPGHRFVRIHRSFVIALQHVSSFNQSEVEIAGQKLPVGISYRDGLVIR